MTNQNLLLIAGVMALCYYGFFVPQATNNTDEQTELILTNLINQINQLNNTI